jgi:hypothetical protein
LRGAQAIGNVYYVVKYSTKAQVLFNNYILLHMTALEKADRTQNTRQNENLQHIEKRKFAAY